MTTQAARVLMLYLEPAPYILGLVRALRRAWPGRIDVLYAAENLTQAWGGWQPQAGDEILPARRGAAMHALWRRLTRHNYDLLHLAGWGHPLLLFALLVAALRGVPVTVESDTHVIRAAHGWKDVVKRLAYPGLFRIPRVFLPGGSPQAAYLRAFGVAQSRILVAQMTSDITAIQDHVRARPPRKRAGTVRFLYLGRLEPHKGVNDLLEAFRALRTAGAPVELAVAGGGSLQAQVEAAATGDHRIRYLGHLKGEEVWDAYAQADAFVLPSRVEPWGLVVNEAMAAGLPVIVTDRAGCAQDLVRDGVSGLVIPAEDPAKLAEAMQRLIQQPAARAHMADAARKIISGWTLDHAAANTIQAWRRSAA